MRLTDFLQEFGEAVEEEKERQAKMKAKQPPRRSKHQR